MQDLLKETVESMQMTTDKHTIIIKNKSKTHVIADRDRVGQVITNLLSNAIKYSPKSNRVVVTTTKQDKYIIISVQDFGVGIPRKNKDEIFDRFFRVNEPQHATFPGLGLGLYISKEIVKRFNGDIWVESQKGKGSVFSFSLPIAH